MRTTRRIAIGLGAALAVAALGGGAARAGSADDAQRLAAAVLAPRAEMASAPHSAMPVKAAADAPVRIAGVAKTAIDRRLDGGAVASAGFMCGLQPGTDRYGAGAAHGYDPTGRFVGAKLSFAFR